MSETLVLQWIKWLAVGNAIVALIIGAGIVYSQFRLIPHFRRYASEWDDRHQSIIDQRDRGERDISVQPLGFNMYQFLELPQDTEVWFRYALKYYDVDSITEVEP